MNEELIEILRRRSNPGILIFNNEGKIVFINNEALSITNNPNTIIDNLKTLYEEFKKNRDINEIKNRSTIFKYLDNTYSVRAFPIGLSEEKEMTHLIMLIEKLVEKREININKARSKYKLTKKEVEIVKLLSEGYSNKDIAQNLSISENTVKDHIKHIMEKMDCNSRAEIIALLR